MSHPWPERTLADLDLTIEGIRASLATHPPAEARRDLLDDLGGALSERYQRTDAHSDLDHLLAASRQSFNQTPVDDPAWAGRAANMSMALQLWFSRTGQESDLDLALTYAKLATEHLRADDYDHAKVWSQHAGLLMLKYERASGSGNPSDVEEAIRLGREAITVGSPDITAHALHLSRLAMALESRFKLDGHDTDLDEAISLVQEALTLPAADHELARIQANFGDLLLTRHERRGDPADLAWALQERRSLAGGAATPPLLRVDAALTWAGIAQRQGDVEDALAGLRAAMAALPIMAWPGWDRADRESALEQLGGLGSQAAAAAIEMGHPEQAVELLEQGTAMLWGQSLRIRSDLSALTEVAPVLAERLQVARQGLDGDAVQGTERARLGRLWDETLNQVRGLPGWHEFLAPLRFEQLSPAADEGPVVWLNVADRRCDALVVTGRRVIVVPLPELDSRSGLEWANPYLESLSYAAQMRGPDNFLIRELFRQALVDLLAWLWDTVAEPVLDALGFTGGPVQELPRLWWCPTGWLSFLPLHAAGHYHPDADPTRAVPRRVVPSYASSLSSLQRARREQTCGPARLLAVGAAEGDEHLPALPGVEVELDWLTTMLPADRLTVRRGREASRATVRLDLREHSWLHLAGHVQPNPEQALHTGIVLTDGLLTLLDLVGLHLDGAEFAYLSACITALGSVRLPSEAQHLPGTLQLAGYRHVIATQWQIEDRHAADLATAVYSQLIQNGDLIADGAARALHGALRTLSERNHPVDWAPYLHFGP